MLISFEQIWELAEGQLLFDGAWNLSDQYTPDAHLAQITAIFGSIPTRLLNRSKSREKYFDADGIDILNLPGIDCLTLATELVLTDAGQLLKPSTFPPCSLEQFSKNGDVSGSEKEKFLRFIESMLRPDPEDRPDARKLRESPWLS